MKVLVVHNRYRAAAPSGEDAVVDAEAALLAARGVEVVRWEQSNDEVAGPVSAAVETVWSRRSRRALAAVLRRERPDVAHVHNVWYRISPAAYAACRDAGVPVVQTLHNFRMFCANALLLRGGRPCEACVGRRPWRAVLHGCYRGSRVASLPVAFAEWLHGARGTWVRGVDRFVALTAFARDKFAACGLPAGKIVVKPNFLADPPRAGEGPGEGALFAGRLSPEKGVGVLLETAVRAAGAGAGRRVAFAGDGELRVAVEAAAAGGGVCLLGRLARPAVLEAMRAARCVVVPSVCYENFPLAIVEAFACGRPVIASRLGAMAEIVEDGVTGLLVAPGDPGALAAALSWAEAHPARCEAMGRAARLRFESRYGADANFRALQAIYDDVRK